MGQWIKADGTTTEVSPKNGKDYELAEMREYIGGGYIEIVNIFPGKYMVIDEEGKMKHKSLRLNKEATKLYRQATPFAFIEPNEGDDLGLTIVGDVLVCGVEEIE